MKHIRILYIAAATLFICANGSVLGQWKNPERASSDSLGQRMETHLMLSTGVVSSHYYSSAYTLVAPSFSFRVNDKVKVNAGFALLTDFIPHGYEIKAKEEKDLKPLKEPAAGTHFASGYLGMTYVPNSNMTVSATAFYMGGSLTNVVAGLRPMDISSWGGNARMTYKTSQGKTLDVSVTFIKHNRDFPFMMHNPFYSGYYGGPLGSGLLYGAPCYGFGAY